QAEDGIRDLTVTGVQTCALPIWGSPPAGSRGRIRLRAEPLGAFLRPHLPGAGSQAGRGRGQPGHSRLLEGGGCRDQLPGCLSMSWFQLDPQSIADRVKASGATVRIPTLGDEI